MVHGDLSQQAADGKAVYALESYVDEDNVKCPLAGDSQGRLSIRGEQRMFEGGLQHIFHGPAGHWIIVNGQDSNRPLEGCLALRTGRMKFMENFECIRGG